MAALEEYPTALRFRDVVGKMISAQLEKERPRYKYATVTSIGSTTCTVRFPGEVVDATINILSIMPSDVGQIVQVDGLASDRFVSGVKGQSSSGGGGGWEPVVAMGGF